MKEKRKWFLGWTNIKWFFREIMKMYSGEPSYFSKKRIESGIAFIIAQWGMIFFLLKKIGEMDTVEFTMWAGIELLIAGYTVNQIQKEKKLNKTEEPPEDYDNDSGPEILHG